MENTLKKYVSYILITTVILLTGLGLLAIWDVIDIEEVIRKMLYSLFVVFVASVVVLFIVSVFIKDNTKRN
ncbi:MAG: hypothetical protein KAI79_09100 [Bacteroidales bacterium]|nr:hypothetical protein [Bacteroidales bacterium]